MAKPTEMTIRDLLQEELRKRGVTVVPEFSVSTPVGRLAPDMLLKNGAQYVVETKLGAETKLLDAMKYKYMPKLIDISANNRGVQIIDPYYLKTN